MTLLALKIHLPARILLSSLCAIAFTLSALCQEIENLGKNVVGLEILHPVVEQIGTNLLEVFYRQADGTFLPKIQVMSGTGFFVQHHQRSYIITAKHVVGTNGVGDGRVLLVDTNGTRTELPIAFIRQVLPSAKWFLHPKADVAVHPYALPPQLHIANVDFSDALLRTNALGLLSPVCASGFPFSWGLGAKISPIATECKIGSWITQVPTQDPALAFILLDKALAQGYSGAPIFTLENPFHGGVFAMGGFHSQIIGLCTGQASDGGGGKVSLIVPASYILEVFQTPEFLEYEGRLPK